MSLRLIIEDDEGSTTIVPLGSDAITIGRQQGNTIQLTEKNVSRRHAQLLPEGQSWVLEDLGSYNGVKVNGRAASGRVALQEGDVVQIGDYHLALTEDVDRRTLNYDRGAANDGVEPMVASSSTSLPKIGPDGLAALTATGQHASQTGATMPPSVVDAGQMPMIARGQGDEQQSRVGAMVVGLAVIGVLALGGFWWATRPSETAAAGGAIAKTEQRPSPTAVADAKAKSTTEAPVPATRPDPAPDANVDPSRDTKVEPIPAVPEPEDDPVPEIARDPKPAPVATPKPKPVTPKPPVAPKPKPEPESVVDADVLLAEAGKQMFKSPSSAYDLAAKAYGSKKSSRAAFLMASAACRLQDAAKARKAIAKLKGQPRDEAVQICAGQGITID